jgi:hypothetical protein
MEGFVDSFIGALELERSYTMLVVNPKWSPSLPSYTYRIGFSEPELRLLHEQVCCGKHCTTMCRGGSYTKQLLLVCVELIGIIAHGRFAMATGPSSTQQWLGVVLVG